MGAHDPFDVPTLSSVGDKARLAPPASGSGSIALEPGATIKHHEIIRRLGSGGMGEVYLARDTRLGRLVALKFLTGATSPERFVAEARATAGITHENIVALYDIDRYGDAPFMVLEYIHGQTFTELLDARAQASDDGALSAERAVELMIPVVRSLVCAHEAGIIHRDLKPSNIMLAHNGSVKVLDFGIARMMHDASAEREPRTAVQGTTAELPGRAAMPTRDSDTYGSLPYMSPEQWGVGTAVDHRSDLWAVGLILHEMVTGRHLLDGLPLEELRRTVVDLSNGIPSVLASRPDLGKLGKVIDRCLAKRQEDRIESAQQLLSELESVARPERSDDAATNPYPGLAAFQERDAHGFYGRERAVAEVVARFSEQPLVAIIGPSGAGKSSFVRAGIIPALKRSGDHWESFVVRPGPRPLLALANLLAQQRTGSTSESERKALAERMRTEPGFLGAKLRRHARRQRKRAILFVDQAEELYTLASAEDRQAFLACLAGAADDVGAPVRVLLALRSDFLDRMTDAPAAVLEAMSRNTILIRPLDREGLRSALIKPAEAAGYRFESSALVDSMLDALEHNAGALPLLQFTAAKLWDIRDPEERLLTARSYRAIGGVAGALASHADAVLGSMRSDERTWARAILLRLVTPLRTRAVVPLRELRELGGTAVADVDRVLDRLIDARLLTVDGSDEELSTIEIVHESLIQRWPVLDRWLHEEEEDVAFTARVRGAARDWEASGFAEGVLWSGEAAKESERWYAGHRARARAILGQREEKFLLGVIALARRSTRRRRLFMGGTMAALSVAVAVVSSMAWQQSRAALRARDATRLAAARTQSSDPTTQLALLRELEGTVPPPGWAAEIKRVLAAGVAVAVLRGHDDPVSGVVFSPDSRRIFSASHDRTLRVWNADGSGQPLVLPLALAGHTVQATGVAFSPDRLRVAWASQDNTVRVAKADGSGRPLVLKGHTEPVVAVVFSPDGQRIATSSADRTVRVWNADGSGEAVVLRGHSALVRSVSFSADGRRIASGSWDQTIRVWNADGSGQPLVLLGHSGKVHQVALSPDGRRLASVADDGVRVWNVDSSGRFLILARHEGGVFTYVVAFSPDGQRVASGFVDGTIRVWTLGGSTEPLLLAGHGGRVYAVTFSPDGARIASASGDRTVRIWNTTDARVPIVIRHPNLVNHAEFSPDGRRIVSGSNDPLIRVWNSDGSGLPVILSGHTDAIIWAKFSPDGRRIASSSYDGTVRVWNADGSGHPLILPGYRYESAAFSPDGKSIAWSGADNAVRILPVDGSGQPIVLEGHTQPVPELTYSPDGRLIASSSWDRTVRFWNSDGTGHPIVFTNGTEIRGVAFSPDSRSVALALGRTLHLWTVSRSGHPSRVVGSHRHILNGVAFSPDGRQIATVGEDRSIHIWNVDGSGESVILSGHTGNISHLAYSRDGRRIATVSTDRTVRISGDLAPITVDYAYLWKATNHCLSVEERQELLGIAAPVARMLHQRCLDRVVAARR